LGSVAAEFFGATGRYLMNLLATRDSELSLEDIAPGARPVRRHKMDDLLRSVQGFFTDHQRYILKSLLQTLADLEAQIVSSNQNLKDLMTEQHPLLTRLKETPGIGEVAAATIWSEIGPALTAFPGSAHLASGAGLCPGNNQSAGKPRRCHGPVRKHHLKTILVEVSRIAIRKPG
jgi:transposase